MKKIKLLLSTVAFIAFSAASYAQIRGGVVDANGFPEVDAQVTVKGTSTVVYTDQNGQFDIDAKIGDVLLINGKEFQVMSNDMGVLKVQEEVALGEVVVLGYGITSTKAKSTVASTTISSEILENRPNTTFLSSIQGAAPGISINSASGSPGSGRIDVRIRGISSLSSSTDPLYIIDGLTTSGTQFRNLNPNDIETLSILRDAQASAIYGNRGANGVVVITTKSARFNTDLKINYDALTGFSLIPKTDYNMANSQQLLTIHNRYGLGLGATMTPEEIAAFDINTNWDKEFLRVGITQQHNLGLNFGGKNVSVYTSLGYLESDGNIKTTNFKRFTIRNNINGRSNNNRFTYASQLALGYSRRHQLDEETNTGISNNVVQNPLFGTILSPPTLPKYNFVNGRDMFNVIRGNTAGRSAWILSDIIRGGVKNRFIETNILANVSGDYKLTDHFSIGNKSGIDYKNNERTFARDPDGYLAVIVASNQGATFGGHETMNNLKDFTFNSVTNLTYNQSFGDHTLMMSALFDYLKAHYLFNSQTQNGLDPLTWRFGSGKGYIPFNPLTPNIYRPTVSANKINAGTLAYLGLLDYDYASKYGFSGILRRDGSYRFSKENRWETFWSVSGRWNLEKEAFLKDSSLSLLKVRASYGTTGNQNLISPTNNLNPLFTGINLFRNLNTSMVGYQNLPGYNVLQIANDHLKWEKISQFNVGLDFNVFNRLLEGSLDYYDKRTDRLFNAIYTSAITGQYSDNGNNGEMSNKGIEASLKLNLIDKKSTKFAVFTNAAHNKNRIERRDDENLTGDVINVTGGVAYQWHLYRFVGINRDTGEQQFLDKNGNITEEPTPDDRVQTGKSFYAKVQGGFGFELDYKGFFASTLLTFQTGGWSYDNFYSWTMDPNTAASFNGSANLLDSWTPQNRDSNLPALTANNMGVEGSSDRFLYRNDFLRLKAFTLGYGFTQAQLAKLPVNSLKLFVSGENMVTWTKWKGYDPEPIRQYSLGIYPNPRTISFGLNVEL